MAPHRAGPSRARRASLVSCTALGAAVALVARSPAAAAVSAPGLASGDGPGDQPSAAPFVAYGVSPRAMRPPVAGGIVRPAPPTVSEGISPDNVRRVVRRNMAQIRRCYEQSIARNPSAEGRVVIRFVVGPRGTVTSAEPAESSMPGPVVGRCIARAVLRWTFPAPEGGQPVTVTYPFVLQRADGS